MGRFVCICLAGALGTGLRYLVQQWASARLGTAFPYGTLIVNVAGCLLMGFIMQLALQASALPATVRLSLTTGFLGGLTTYSSFNFETTQLLQASERRGALLCALLNLGGTLVLCFGAGLLGWALARRLATL